DMGSVYARASVLQQFMGDAKVTGYTAAGATIHETDGNDTWMEYGIGANVKLTDKTYIWADVERTAGADVDEEWRGTVGVRFSF
ncbi:MAG: autotransporter outer membrane beta-barrel domain-containing protein, partial [Mailhella sp.]|nr:autotransporter outer membrane beta-barrel domain-containing protein [Mailhella sp.]